jgi:3-hydroxyacyl-CoA dehydrogenase
MATSFALRGRVALIRITRPPVNSLGHAVRQGIADGLDKAEAANAAAIVIAGDGATFPAGADIAEFATGGHLDDPALGPLIERISALDIHTVAAVHGTALGGGCEVALGCHWRLLHEKGRFGLPEVHLGILPGAGGTQRLPRVVAYEEAIRMMTTGAMVNAKAALSSGLADEVVAASGSVSPSEAVIEAAVAFAEEKLVGQPIDPSRVVAARTLRDPGAEFFEKARAMATRAARGEVAPPAIVDAVQAAVQAPSFEAGLAREGELFMGLATGDQAGALQQVFMSERLISKVVGLPKDVKPKGVKKAAVVGAGTMGGGIAMCFAEAGIDVTLIDQSAEALERGLATCRRNWEATAKKGRISAEAVEERVSKLRGSTTYDDAGVREADVVVEAAFETMDVKRKIFAQLDAVAKPGCLLATNTSTLSIDEIATSTSRPEDVIGMHFFSPANVMPLLENVKGERSSPQAVATAMGLGKRLRKKAVLAANCFGFIGNRMLEPYVREALYMIEEGATPQQVDKVRRAATPPPHHPPPTPPLRPAHCAHAYACASSPQPPPPLLLPD